MFRLTFRSFVVAACAIMISVIGCTRGKVVDGKTTDPVGG